MEIGGRENPFRLIDEPSLTVVMERGWFDVKVSPVIQITHVNVYSDSQLIYVAHAPLLRTSRRLTSSIPSMISSPSSTLSVWTTGSGEGDKR